MLGQRCKFMKEILSAWMGYSKRYRVQPFCMPTFKMIWGPTVSSEVGQRKLGVKNVMDTKKIKSNEMYWRWLHS